MVETVRLYLPVSPVRLRDDEGIVPYAEGRFLPLNLARPMLLGVPSTPVRASPCHPLQAGEGFIPPPEEAFPSGEGGRA